MHMLENIAAASITKVTPAMLPKFVNRVERYYAMASRQDDLVEFP